MIRVTARISIDERDIEESFIRSSGPGGQNVNKVATAVQLRFIVNGESALPVDLRERLVKLAGKRMTADGVLVLTADRYRTQDRNREDARARLVALLQRAAERPKQRRATKPTKGSQERRLQGKTIRSNIKKMRRSFDD